MEGVKRKTVEEIRKGVASSCNNYIHISRVFRATHMRLGEGLAIINARINSLSLSLSLSLTLVLSTKNKAAIARWVRSVG